MANIYCAGCFLTNIRLIFHLTVFSKSFRVMITIIVNAIFQLKDFLMILYMLVFIISICNYIVSKDVRIAPSFAEAYQTMFGENLEDMPDQNGPQQILYIISTNIQVVVCLNILISIVTDNYDNVQ